jgi:23S rRNA (cytosine1962-C5)-methyltransferase
VLLGPAPGRQGLGQRRRRLRSLRRGRGRPLALQGQALEKFDLAWGEAKFHGQFTPFRHLAFFPEQAANWAWQDARVRAFKDRQPKVLNLFGYTGVASLVCAAAGAAVTHVDASKKSVGFARENAAFAGLADKPIRWIVEDARRFVAREVRRGSQYDGIILDPPKFGRGADGEVWRLFEDLAELTANCAQILAPDASFLLMNAYAARVSGAAMSGLLAQELKGAAGSSTGASCRWSRKRATARSACRSSPAGPRSEG